MNKPPVSISLSSYGADLVRQRGQGSFIELLAAAGAHCIEWREELLTIEDPTQLADATQAKGLKSVYSSPKPAVEQRFDAQYRNLPELLQQADFVCLTLPLTAETEGLIGAEQFALMRPETIFINISRGKVVDETALIEALRSRQIRAAGLDAFEREPLNLTRRFCS